MAAYDVDLEYSMAKVLLNAAISADANWLEEGRTESELKDVEARNLLLDVLRQLFEGIHGRCKRYRPEERGYTASVDRAESILATIRVMQAGNAVWSPKDRDSAQKALGFV